MIDLHVHILPGLDDGARSVDEAVAMAQLALESGVDTIVATPHSNQEGRFENYNTSELTGAYERFCQVLRDEHLPLKILPGMEILASEEMGKKMEDGRLIGLNHSNYYLVEFPFDAEVWWMGEMLEEILERGKIPLIAHPERYYGVQEYPALVWEWLELGCYTQVNKGSLFEKFGRRVRHTVETLIENDLVTCVASDAHSPYMRTTYMGDVRDYLVDWLGEEQAGRLLKRNAEIIINGGKVPGHGVMPQQKRWFFR